MKILKYVLFTLLGLLAVLLLVALFVPRKFHAGSEIVINRPTAEVFDYIKLIRNQGDYDNWSRQDPAIKKSYSGTDGTVGFRYVWESKKVGDGEQVITKIDDGKEVHMDLFFQGSKEANKSSINVEEVAGNQSKVVWIIDGKMPYPFNLMTLCYDMNKDFELGLQNLKAILEK